VNLSDLNNSLNSLSVACGGGARKSFHLNSKFSERLAMRKVFDVEIHHWKGLEGFENYFKNFNLNFYFKNKKYFLNFS
jgi:hypothetical protein